MNETSHHGQSTGSHHPAADKPPVADGAARKRKPADDTVLVGIGASAGGLDALQRVLPGLPADSGMAYIIVQHLAPEHGSLLTSLLKKYTEMPVNTIRDGMLVKPDAIFIAPPNKNVRLSGNRLNLVAPSARGPRPSIDYFFASLAEEKKAHSVGIILSGTGSDGAHGIRAIKSNDGITMAQTNESAKFGGMPQAAIATGLVDLVVPPEKIGEELETALAYPHRLADAPPDEDAEEVNQILEMLLAHTGVDFMDYKHSTIHRRVSRRMVIHKLENLKDYIAFIETHTDELAELQKDLLISVTSFFRDAEAFEALAGRLRELFAGKHPGDTFRAWIPGCSTGEEAYTIAILVAEALGNALGKYRVQIFATDVHEDSVAIARKGVYPVATLMETEGRRFEKYFSHDGDTVKVKKHIRDLVILARQDLIKDTPFLHLDLISCRNLMIYLNAEMQEKLLSLFQFSLHSGGILFLGKSESINRRMDLFETLDNRWRVYRRKDTGDKRLPKLMQNSQRVRLGHLPTAETHRRSGRTRESLLFGELLDLLDGCLVLADEIGNVQYVRGDVGLYLRIPQGKVSQKLNAVDTARPEIRYVLQSLLHKSRKENRSVASSKVVLDDDAAAVRIKVGPIHENDTATRYLIAFLSVDPPKSLRDRASSPDESDPAHTQELEQELQDTRDHLQDAIEELETGSEEMQSLNEELQSANEELQATNEELETSNEELQASNEELNTINDELRAKSEEAAELLTDLRASEKRYRSLVDNMNEAIMLCELEFGVDRQPTDLIIKQANRALESLISIQGHELPLRAGSAGLQELTGDDMLARFLDVSRGGSPQRFSVRLAGIEKELTLSVFNSSPGNLGVVCRDDTEQKRAERALKESEARYRELVQNANSAIIRWKTDGTLTFFNEYAQDFFGYGADAVVGKNVRILLPDQNASGADPATLVDDIVSAPQRFVNNINENVCSDGRRVWMAWTNKPITDDDGQVVEILAVGADITRRMQTEKELQRLNDTLEKQVIERTALAENRAKQLQALSVELIEAEERERQRIAEVLHDDLQQLLAGARLQLQAACPDLPESSVLTDVEKLLDASIEKSRYMAHELSPPILNQGGFVPALKWLIRQMRDQFGLSVHLNESRAPGLKGNPVNYFLFRSIKELLLNVIKHAESRAAHIDVDSTDHSICVTVRDDGRGFDPEKARGESRPSGFGLMGIEERAISLGGDLFVDSTPGKGSRIQLTVPFITAKTELSPEIGQPAGKGATLTADTTLTADGLDNKTGIRVLVVDDHKLMRQGLIGLIARQPDIQVVGEADNGRQALALSRQLQPDAILMDVSMPEMDGIEATERIKAELPDVRVVGLSMHEDEHIARRMQRVGAEAFISKTVSPAELLKVLYGIEK